MTTPYLLADLRRDEGLRLAAYPDPVSHGDPWTIGYGHTGPEVHAGLKWTDKDADEALASDVAKVAKGLDTTLPWWRDLDEVRQDVLANMAFNLGVHRLASFINTLAFIRARNWPQAARAMRLSLWAREVGARAERLAMQMQTGARAP